MSMTKYRMMIDDFENHYKYDCTYMRELLESSPTGFAKFSNFLPLSSHRENLSVEDYWLAKLSAMQIENCGDCLQLNVRMALEAGVSKSIIQAVLSGGSDLPDALNDICEYAKFIASGDAIPPDHGIIDRMKTRYGRGTLLELGLCVATAKVFPTIKRALGYTKSCTLVEIEM